MSSTLKHHAPPASDAVASILERTSRELLQIAGLVESAQGVVSRVLKTNTITDIDIAAYQDLDLAIQSIGAVSDFILALKLQMPDDVTARSDVAASAIPLHDVASRLSGLRSMAAEPDDGDIFFV